MLGPVWTVGHEWRGKHKAPYRPKGTIGEHVQKVLFQFRAWLVQFFSFSPHGLLSDDRKDLLRFLRRDTEEAFSNSLCYRAISIIYVSKDAEHRR